MSTSLSALDTLSDAKLISYYEESPVDYRFYFTLYKNCEVEIVIKYTSKVDYMYKGKLSKEETKNFFTLINKINFNKATNTEVVARGSESFRLEVLYTDELKIIHSSLKNINKSDALLLLHRKIKEFFK